MNEERDQIFIDVKSANSFRSLHELVDEAFSERDITICQYRIGAHINIWRKAQKGDPVLFAIDDIGCAGGEITYLLKKAFRPRFLPDNESYKSMIHFARGMNPKLYTQQWTEYMIERHFEAIEKKRWLFLVLAVIAPTYRLEGNRELLMEKAREMSEAEDALDKEAARWMMGDYMEGEGYAG